MGSPVTVALDAMGGDFGPSVVIPAAALSLIRHPESRYILFGRRIRDTAHMSSGSPLASVSKIVHTDVSVAMDEKPSQALRHGRWKSSMWLALDAVKKGEAQVAVSAGNTGALMAMAKFCLRTLPGIDRPAIAALWPTLSSESVVLDVGANVGANARSLVDCAGMGAALARALFQVEKPTVGLLNIGAEEAKGLDEIRAASAALRNPSLPIDYRGFIEGDDLGKGVVDVVVTEGFSGNIALKTAEGTAKQIGALSASRDEPFAARAHRGASGARRVPGVACKNGHAQNEWWNVSRFERSCYKKSWGRGRGGLCKRHRPGLRHRGQRASGQYPA